MTLHHHTWRLQITCRVGFCHGTELPASRKLLGYMSTMVCLFLHTMATGVRKLHALVTRQVQDPLGQSTLSERQK